MVDARREIHWRPWGEEAFSDARKLGRPILLDIGATWCHWCHVMEETTYSDEEVTRLVEEYYIPVKVDRDRNPEVDRRYQFLVGSVTGEGGWPLTAILTPEGDLITGGTYFPPKDTGGRPGLRRILRDTHEQWKGRGKEGGMDTYRLGVGEPKAPLSADSTAQGKFFQGVLDSLQASYDDAHGGFGHAPKFPHPLSITLAFAAGKMRQDDRLAQIAVETLQRMAEGGVFDQLGGGFHRYSVDHGWHIPHFEKLATDQAFHLRNYIEAFEFTGEDRHLGVVREIVRYLREVMALPEGGFASSQDADRSPGDDGSYFTWSRKELLEILTRDEWRVFQRRYGVDTEGLMPHSSDQNVLFQLFPPEEIASSLNISLDATNALLTSAIGKAQSRRKDRKSPTVDPTRYAVPNGYLGGALALAGRLSADLELIGTAEKAVELFVGKDLPQSGVPHEVRPDGTRTGRGILEDQVAIASGLLDLAEVTGKATYLRSAGKLLEFIQTKFRDSSGLLSDIADGVFDGHIPPGAGDKRFPLEDAPLLSPNSAAAIALLRYADLTGTSEPATAASAIISSAIPHLEGAGFFASSIALAQLISQTEPLKVGVIGKGPAFSELLEIAVRHYYPRKLVLAASELADQAFPPGSLPATVSEGKKAMAIVCLGQRCLAPAYDVSELKERLASLGKTTPETAP